MFNEKNIKLFGRVAVRDTNHSSSEFKTAHSRALLVFLALYPGIEQPRKRLFNALWPGEHNEPLGNRLSVALYHLKQSLDAVRMGFSDCLVAKRDYIVLNDSEVSIDYSTFRSSMSAARLATNVALKRMCYLDAVGEYAGMLAPVVFAPWIVAKQIESERMFHEAVLWLAHDYDEQGSRAHATNLLSHALDVSQSAKSVAELLSQWNLEQGEVVEYSAKMQTARSTDEVHEELKMSDLMHSIHQHSAPQNHAAVYLEESVFSVLLARAADVQLVAKTCLENGAKPTQDGNGYLFRSPLVALSCAKEITRLEPRSALLIHTAIMSEGDSISSSALLALAQAELKHVWSTEAFAVLVNERGVRTKRQPKSSLWRFSE